MKTVLVLGAGHSSPFLIRYLLERAAEREWRVRVADRDPELAASRVAGHAHGAAVGLDATSVDGLSREIEGAELVVDLMPPRMQTAIARQCVRHGRHLVSVSYADRALRELDGQARHRGVLLLSEIGLDPGIDHMATMALLERLRGEAAVVESFVSYGGGLPAPDSIDNPLGYAVTWNPRNVVMAGESGALYLVDGRLRAVPRERVFAQTWRLRVDGLGELEAYPNRDSLAYRRVFGLDAAHTVIRGTLRYPGWCSTWQAIVRLGLPSEELSVPGLREMSFAELVELFLPPGLAGRTVEERAAAYLGLAAGDPTLERLRWLGLFSDEATGSAGATPADALVALLGRRLRLPPGGRDVIVLRHEVVVRRPGGGRQRLAATLIEHGEPGGVSAMARSVGLPTGIVARRILDGELELTGCHIPTEPAVYRPVLAELEREGLAFREEVVAADATAATP